MALMLFFSGGASSGSRQGGPDNEGLLVGLLVKTWNLRERVLSDIQTNDRQLQASEARFLEAEKRMSNAVATYNDQAIHAAREPLRKARADFEKLKQTKARVDLAMTWAEASYVAVRNGLVSDQDQGSNALILGLISFRSGKVKAFKKNGEEVAFDSTHPRFLEPGDELMTMDASIAEFHTFDGRATIRLGERSRVKLEASSPQEQVVELIQGKVYCAVDSVDKFADLLRESSRNLEADQTLREALARTGERINAWTDKSIRVQSPGACCSVRGAEFSVRLAGSGQTEFSILEGEVEVGDADCAQRVPVVQGFRILVTKDGISEPQKVSDAEKWWEK